MAEVDVLEQLIARKDSEHIEELRGCHSRVSQVQLVELAPLKVLYERSEGVLVHIQLDELELAQVRAVEGVHQIRRQLWL